MIQYITDMAGRISEAVMCVEGGAQRPFCLKRGAAAVQHGRGHNPLFSCCSTTGKPTRSFATERVSLDSV
jgi:hypothetical protein